MRRTLAVAAALLAIASCSRDPFKDFTIDAVEIRSAPKLEFLRARVGMRFLEIRFEFENRSDGPVSLRAIDFALRDSGGTLHPFSAQVLNMGQPRGQTTVEVPRGMRQAGSIVFQVPNEARPAELIYRYEQNGGLVVRLSSGG